MNWQFPRCVRQLWRWNPQTGEPTVRGASGQASGQSFRRSPPLPLTTGGGPGLRGWLPGGVAVLVMLLLKGLGVGQPFEQAAYRSLFHWRGATRWDSRIVVIAIDDVSLRAFGHFPWPRWRYTQLLNRLDQVQPNGVVFNLLFADPSPDDAGLAAAMARHRQVILAQAWDNQGQISLPPEPLQQAAIALGHIGQREDTDGLVRRLDLAVEGIPALSVAAQTVYGLFGSAPPLPSDWQQPLWINWPGPIAQLPQYSFVDVVEGRIPPQQFRDRLILVGVTATGMSRLVTPFDRATPASGVHFQAAALNTLLRNNGLTPLPKWCWLGMFLLLGPGLSQLLSRLPLQGQWAMGSALGVGWWLGCGWLLHWNYWFPVAEPIGLIVLTTLSVTLRQQHRLLRLNSKLQQLATLDELTQVANRRHLEDHLQCTWKDLARQQEPLALIICDVDFFKNFNDTYGHPAGDRCLSRVASVLQTCIKRPRDLLGRYGGEEFLVILPNTDATGALRIAEEMRQRIAVLAIDHAGSQVSRKFRE